MMMDARSRYTVIPMTDYEWVETWQSDDVEREAAQDIVQTVNETMDDQPERNIPVEDVEGAVVAVYTSDGQYQVLEVASSTVRHKVKTLARAVFDLHKGILGERDED